ncbi:hypothetical protein Tco_0816231 [Tanacetum coccineum]
MLPLSCTASQAISKVAKPFIVSTQPPYKDTKPHHHTFVMGGNPPGTESLGAAVLIGLAALSVAAILEVLCLAVLMGTMPDLVKTAVGTKFLLELEKF